jgi:hypothetical protein
MNDEAKQEKDIPDNKYSKSLKDVYQEFDKENIVKKYSEADGIESLVINKDDIQENEMPNLEELSLDKYDDKNKTKFFEYIVNKDNIESIKKRNKKTLAEVIDDANPCPYYNGVECTIICQSDMFEGLNTNKEKLFDDFTRKP